MQDKSKPLRSIVKILISATDRAGYPYLAMFNR